MQDEAAAIHLISEGTAEVAAIFLEAYGITLPPEVDIVPLIEFGIEQSTNLCANDCTEEITATINFVNQNLRSRTGSFSENHPRPRVALDDAFQYFTGQLVHRLSRIQALPEPPPAEESHEEGGN